MVVVARQDASGDARLIAYYTGESVSAESLRGHASGTLPEHMVPSGYVHLTALPLTANGKVDRARCLRRAGNPSCRGRTKLHRGRWRKRWRGSGRSFCRWVEWAVTITSSS